jgi:imidazoleglycerol-phosphate dehydratase
VTESSAGRRGTVSRTTSETDLRVELNLDGAGKCDVQTRVPFFDHMLAQIARHGLIDLTVRCSGDIEVDAHHTVEDTGIALGQALRQAFGGTQGIRRFGHAYIPFDETLAFGAVDVSGRPFIAFEAAFPRGKVGEFDTELVPEFFRALAVHAGITLHLRVLYGSNTHHMVEALFKAFARALDAAKQQDPRLGEAVPSTKGSLS